MSYNDGHVVDLKRAKMMLQSVNQDKADMIVVEETTPAAVLSFPDGAKDQPMKLEVAVEPVQDLHGYDKPWVGGAGKNLYGGTTGEIFDLPRTIAANTDVVVSFVRSGEGQVTVNVYKTGETTRYDYRTITGNLRSFTLEQDTARVMLVCAEGVTISNVQLELGSSATTYEPYSNICPISGFDNAEVTRTGKNVAKDVNSISATTQYTYALKCSYELRKGRKYVISFDTPNTGLSIYRQTPSSLGFDSLSEYSFTLDGTRKSMYGTANEDVVKSNVEVLARLSATSTTGTGIITNFMIEPVADDVTIPTTYEPFVGNTTYTIAFPSPTPGTVYGGTLTVNQNGTGSLVVDRARFQLDEISDFVNSSSSYKAARHYFANQIVSGLNDDKVHIISEVLQGTKSQSSNFILGSCYTSGSTGQESVITIVDPNMTVSEYNSKYAGTYVVCDLITSVSYTLSVDQVKTLLGQNNIWADTGDVLSVDYPADTKSYIDNLFSSITSAEGQTF